MNIPKEIRRPKTGSRNQRGMITVVFIALLAIMMVLLMVESSAVLRLHREVKLQEHRQIERLSGPQTNVVHIALQP
jgi:hypothetical protein